jgi:hypothetical protein
VPVLTSSGFTGGPFDFEMLVAPKVSYTITTDFTVTPNSTCLGTAVNFTNTTTPTSILSSRFYNYNQFLSYFQSIPDSTFVYDMDGVSPLVWSGNTSYTYTTAAVHNPVLYTLGGFWASCLDNNTKTVTINPTNTASAASSSPTVCINTAIPNVTHTTTGATSIGAAVGLPSGVTANWVANTITISGTPTVSGTFNYTIPLLGGCGTVNAIGTIVVTPIVTPTFSAVGPYCLGAVIPALPTTSTNSITGTWSPALDNTATTTYTFTPNVGQCGTTNT